MGVAAAKRVSRPSGFLSAAMKRAALGIPEAQHGEEHSVPAITEEKRRALLLLRRKSERQLAPPPSEAAYAFTAYAFTAYAFTAYALAA